MSSPSPISDPEALDVRLLDLARREHGVVTRAQLLEVGASPAWVRGRVRRRHLDPLHRGVYQVGPVRAPFAREMAALLASGPNATICRRSAAALWDVFPRDGQADLVEVYVGEVPRRRPGVRAYRTTTLRPDEVMELHGLRVTTLERTLLDLAGDAAPPELHRALARAGRREDLDLDALVQLTQRHPRRRGVGRLRRLMAEGAEADFTRSQAEERFLSLVRRAGLPRPETNARVEGYEVDFVWRGHRLVVEVDGYAFHSSRQAFEWDRHRDARITGAGFRIIRVTWRQLAGKPEAVLVPLARALTPASAGRK